VRRNPRPVPTVSELRYLSTVPNGGHRVHIVPDPSRNLEPRVAQFRIDLRAIARWISARSPSRLGLTIANAFIGGLSLSFRTWELLVLTLVLQIGMLPLMARDFHRITLAAPLVNLAAVPLTSAIVPIGFFALGIRIVFPAVGQIVAAPLSWLTLALLHIVHWFSKFPRWSYRIPRPPVWLLVIFFVLAALIAVTMRVSFPWKRAARVVLCLGLAFCSIVIALFPLAPTWAAGKLELTVLDVGRGDSLFVVFPPRQNLTYRWRWRLQRISRTRGTWRN